MRVPKAALLIVALVTACSDAEPGESPLAPEISRAVTTTSAPPRIHWKSATAVFPTQLRAALVDGSMNYDGLHASIGATVNIYGPTSASRVFTPVQRHTQGFYDNNHTASFQVPVQAQCGHSVQATVRFAVWAADPDGNPVSPVTDQETADSSQRDCDTGEEDLTVPTGGGGGHNGCPSCMDTPVTGYTWCKVRVKYYVDTGEVISQTTLYCW